MEVLFLTMLAIVSFNSYLMLFTEVSESTTIIMSVVNSVIQIISVFALLLLFGETIGVISLGIIDMNIVSLLIYSFSRK